MSLYVANGGHRFPAIFTEGRQLHATWRATSEGVRIRQSAIEPFAAPTKLQALSSSPILGLVTSFGTSKRAASGVRRMLPNDLSDEEILFLVGTTDAELFEAGEDIKQRYWTVPQAVMIKLGLVPMFPGTIGRSKIYDRIEKAFSSIYRPQDIALGGHIGVFMYRDIYAKIQVPHAYGHVLIDPFKYVELTPIQLRIIRTEPRNIDMFIDQFIDVADIQHGVERKLTVVAQSDLVARFIHLSRLHIHAAAAILTGGYDHRGAVQSALLATELALKSGAAASGLTEEKIKKDFSHDLKKLAAKIATTWPNFDRARVERVIEAQPGYVSNRYDSSQPDRRAVGHIVMGAQYVVAETMRQMSGWTQRNGIDPQPVRSYPK